MSARNTRPHRFKVGLSKIFFLLMFYLCEYTLAENEFRFIIVSDLHVSEKDGGEKFRTFLQKVDELQLTPDFIIVTGDIHAKPFRKILEEYPSKYRFFVAFGNHERREDRESLRELLSLPTKDRDFYSFTHKSVRFLFLCDASDFGDHIGHFESEGIRGKEQQVWLEKELDVDQSMILSCFIFAHIPPSQDGKGDSMYISTNDQKELRELFRRYKPSAMFCGHLHRRVEFSVEGVPVYVVPSLNWNFDNEPPGFYLVYVNGDKWKTEFIQLSYLPGN